MKQTPKLRFFLIIAATLLLIGFIYARNEGLLPTPSSWLTYEPAKPVLSDDQLIEIEATVKASVIATITTSSFDNIAENVINVEDSYVESTTNLPGTVLDVVAAKGGQYFVLKIHSIAGLSVYDAQNKSLIHTIRLDSSDFLYTAGGNVVLVYYPEHNLLQTWSLDTFEKLKTKANPLGAVATELTMGHSNSQRALVRYAAGTSPTDNVGMYILNIDRLERVPGGGEIPPNKKFNYTIYHRTNGQMQIISEWGIGSPGGLGVYILTEGGWSSNYKHESVGYIAVGDDQFIYTENGRILNSQLTQIGTINNTKLIPGINSTFFLSVNKNGLLQVHTSGSTTPISGIGFFPASDNIITELFKPRLHSLFFDRRIFFVPNDGFILFIPPENNRIIQRSFNLTQHLEELGIDYLAVTSIPDTIAIAGETWQYQLEVLSNSTVTRYHLEFGLEGMEIGDNGLITWQVPAEHSGIDRIVVLIENEKNDSTYHSFDLQVKEVNR